MATQQPNELLQCPSDKQKPPDKEIISKDMLIDSNSQATRLRNSLTDLINAINAKRDRDNSLLAVKTTLHRITGQTNAVVQSKLQEVLQVIERIGLLEAEMEECRSAFSALYAELNMH